MLTIPARKTGRYCDGRSRRDFLRIGMAGLGSIGLPSLLRARAAAKESGASKDTSVILLWLDGGASHHDTYDPKPTAPAEYRGIWGTQSTSVPGTQISEMFPLQAQIAEKFSIIRSIYHNNGDHFAGGHHMLTGRGGASGADTTVKFPFFGAIATKVLGSRKPGLPPHVAIPQAMSIGLRPGYFGGHYLGPENDPFDVGSDPSRDNFKVKNLSLDSSVTVDRLADRRNLLNQFDKLRREVDNRGLIDAIDEFDRQAYHMVTGKGARTAFDIAAEDDKTRDRYGRHSWGQSALLARRLVEAGSTFVTCHFGGWDSHWNHEGTMLAHLPKVDQIVSALITDLEDRGRLESTMVIVMSEFSRTPKMNDGGNGGPPLSKGTPGRDHWGNAMSVLVAGGGIRGGQVVGSTNRLGETPLDRPLRPGDLHHTVFKVLGVDPNLHFNDMAGRPIVAIDHGQVIDELF